MDKAPILSSKDIFDWLEKNNPMGDSSDADRYIQRDADHEYYMKLIKEIELECEARLKEQSVIHSMEIEQVKKETAQEIFSELLNFYRNRPEKNI
jgi:hypothetical protein